MGKNLDQQGSNVNSGSGNLTANAATDGGGSNNGASAADILKTSWMTKRSQLKSRFSFTNYKERWFVLTRTSLLYYDSIDTIKKKEKGKIALSNVRLIERVTIRDDAKLPAFQIGYQDPSSKQEYSLYIQAKSEKEVEEWLSLTRNLCRNNTNLAEKFHPQQWSAGRWLCCNDNVRSTVGRGCEPITWTPRQSKTDPVPPLPGSALSATAMSIETEEPTAAAIMATTSGTAAVTSKVRIIFTRRKFPWKIVTFKLTEPHSGQLSKYDGQW